MPERQHERICKDVAVAEFEVLSLHLAGVEGGLKKNTRNVTQEILLWG